MRFRTVLFLAAAAWLVVVRAVPGADTDVRIEQIEERMAATRAMIAECTNDVERAQWQQRLNLLEQDLDNVKRRIVLDEKEQTLTAAHKRHALSALREELQAVNTDTSVAEAEARRLAARLRELRYDRTRLGDERTRRSKTEGVDPAVMDELSQRVRTLDDEIMARSAERDAVELKLRLAAEATRLDTMLRTMPVNPRPTIRLLLDKRHYLAAERKQADDTARNIDTLRERHKELLAALELSQEKAKHIDEEISLLDRKARQAISSRSEARLLSSAANTEKKTLVRRIEFQSQTVTAIEQSVSLSEQLRTIYAKESDFLDEDLDVVTTRFKKELYVPVAVIAGLIVGRLALSWLVFPIFYRRDNLFVARRLSGYVLTLLIIVVLAFFFLEDLKQVATVLGIASAAIVIALQDLCSAFAGWFVIVASRKFKVGDRVEVDGMIGDVIDIQLLRTTLLELRNWLGVDEPTGRVVMIPNNFVFKTRVYNYSHVHPFIWNKVDITVTFETPAREAQALLQRVLEEETRQNFAEAAKGAHHMERQYGIADTTYVPKVFSIIEDSGVLFRLLYVAHYRQLSSTRNRINERIIVEFEKDPRMQFAYPTQRHIPTPEKDGFKVVTGPAK